MRIGVCDVACSGGFVFCFGRREHAVLGRLDGHLTCAYVGLRYAHVMLQRVEHGICFSRYSG